MYRHEVYPCPRRFLDHRPQQLCLRGNARRSFLVSGMFSPGILDGGRTLPTAVNQNYQRPNTAIGILCATSDWINFSAPGNGFTDVHISSCNAVVLAYNSSGVKSNSAHSKRTFDAYESTSLKRREEGYVRTGPTH